MQCVLFSHSRIGFVKNPDAKHTINFKRPNTYKCIDILIERNHSQNSGQDHESSRKSFRCRFGSE